MAGPGSSTTSTWLIMRAREGDRTALGRLIARCLPSLARWAHRRLPRSARAAVDTTDVVHGAVVRTLQRNDDLDLRSREALAGYLREAVHNRIRDEYRRIARRGVHDTLPDSLADGRPSPFEATLSGELETQYRDALARLDARDRELIVAHVELGYTHAQLGVMTGRSPNAARMALARAIRRLAAHMHGGA